MADETNQNNQNMEPEKTSIGLVKPRILEQEMEESYLDYAMSVIVSRALPDVRDGLKPVHRRVLYTLGEMGLTHQARYRKSATVVGEVMGKYHPHGDLAIYDTLVRLAQNFAMRYPLVDGQGNFGSMDGDPAAAMRYTESRLAAVSDELLEDIDKATVDFAPNYDNSRQEPQVLPARLPNLLLNGSMGIAVGMATNIPPHNLGELIDALIHLLSHPEASIEELMEFIRGPDFPTGANIYDENAIKEAYTTGKGKIVMRAVAEIVEKKAGGFQIIVSQLPYQVNKAELISKIADLTREKKLEGIVDLRDESDRKEGVRIVIDLKSTAYPRKLLNRLYELTPMQTAFHVNLLALVDGILPRVLTLKNILDYYLAHRQKVIRRRTEFELKRAKERLHILEGLKKALGQIEAVIETIKKSTDRAEAQANLIKKFGLSEAQSNAILEMKLAALASLERDKIIQEHKEKLTLIKNLEGVLASPEKIRHIISKELTALKTKYGDERRTRVYKNPVGEFSAEDLIPNEQVIVTLTRTNYIKRVPVGAFRSQLRGGKGVVGMMTKEEDVVGHMATTWTHDDIMFFTDLGRVFVTKVYDLPSSARQSKGQAIVNVLQISPEEKITAIITITPGKLGQNKYFVMGTKAGIAKKTAIVAYQHIRKTGLIALKLRPNDKLRWVEITSGDNEIMMVSQKGQSIRFSENDLRPMGRAAAGVRGIKLRSGDQVIAMTAVHNPTSDLLCILENGFGKRTPIAHFHLQRRGGVGIRAAKVTPKTGNLVKAEVIETIDGDIVLVSTGGQVIRMLLKSVKRLGRDTQGVTLMRLKGADKVASATLIQKNESESVQSSPEKKEESKKVEDKKVEERIKDKKPESKPSKLDEPNQEKLLETPKTIEPKIRLYQAPEEKPEKRSAPSEPNYWGRE